jgi:hypothetical protein
MTHPIIKTENYLLVVDESKIESGSKSLLILDGFQDGEPMILSHWQGVADGYLGKKIIYHLPLNNAPTLEGVELLPPLEVVKYDFAKMFYNICKATYPEFDEWIEAKEYNKSKAKETYPNSDDDMVEFGEWCENLQKYNKEIRRNNPSITRKELLQLWKEQKPKLPTSFDTETKQYIY